MTVRQFLLFFTLTILFGILLDQTEIFTRIQFGIILLIVLLFSTIGLLGGIFEMNSKAIQLSGFIIAMVIMIGISTVASSKFRSSQQQKDAKLIITVLDKYKVQKGNYPENFTKVNLENRENRYDYRPDSSRQEFQLTYSVDGWHHMTYSSKTAAWLAGD